ncbi:putative ATP-grasp-modified RiPP [Streptomyces sp. Caat 7-52]|uniref:putative ATP-grasp-modified RiPP n=1 Tax=Streptomyces sp. Caat 7-52 TaxID=2949637 RepID=UPI0020364970|nr:putative ATP-grasp-modified RiPP [Streptomyces sp. Caat 7-52]
MFVHSDRLPMSTPVPRGTATPLPWGISRMAPYPTMGPAYAHAELDPATQTTRFFDSTGRVMEMPGHGTSTGTQPSTGTSPDGNGTTQDSDTGSDNDQ